MIETEGDMGGRAGDQTRGEKEEGEAGSTWRGKEGRREEGRDRWAGGGEEKSQGSWREEGPACGPGLVQVRAPPGRRGGHCSSGWDPRQQ